MDKLNEYEIVAKKEAFAVHQGVDGSIAKRGVGIKNPAVRGSLIPAVAIDWPRRAHVPQINTPQFT